MLLMGDLVSVIMPVHNDEKYLHESISSVIAQSYKDWELIIVDDCSTDGSTTIIDEYCKRDNRIKALKTDIPSGSPAIPRNIGISNANGRYISFLDSDDKWRSTKLLRQIECLRKNEGVAIVYSNYRKMDEDGCLHNSTINAPSSVNYKKLLCGNVIGCLTALYDRKVIGKQFFPQCGHEDYVLWLSLLRNGEIAVNTNTEEALYRVRKTSVSSNKYRAMLWQWNIYRSEEHLGLIKSTYYFINYAIRAYNKRRK